jgi:putative endopeptidase
MIGKARVDKMDYKNVDTVIVGQPEYYRALNNAALTRYSINDWKLYLYKNLVNIQPLDRT